MPDRSRQLQMRNIRRLANTPEEVRLLLETLSRVSPRLQSRDEPGGWKNFQLGLGAGRRPYHRSTDPSGEWAQNLKEVDSADLLVCLGTGFGYQIVPLIREFGPRARGVIIVENHPLPLFALLSSLDLSEHLPDNAAVLFAPEPVRLAQELLLAGNRYHPTRVESTYLDSYGEGGRLYLQQAVAVLEAAWQRHRVFLLSLEEQHRHVTDHILANFGSAGSNHGFVEGGARGRRALLAASGPSLDLNKALLPAVAERAHVIAVGSALEPLLEAGVAPDLVVATDPKSVNLLHFPDDEYHIDLAFDPSVAPGIVGKFKKRKILLNVGHALTHLLAPYMPAVGVYNWGTVSSAALSLCALAGFDEIALAGMDFAFQDESHAADYQIDMARWHDVEVEDLLGVRIKSTTMFVEYAGFFAHQAAELEAAYGVRIVNLSEGGILHNIRNSSLREYLYALRETGARKGTWRWETRAEQPAAKPTEWDLAEQMKLDDIRDALAAVGRSATMNRLMSHPPASAAEGFFLKEARRLEKAILEGDAEEAERLKMTVLEAIAAFSRRVMSLCR